MAAPDALHRARHRAELDLLVSMYPTECKRYTSNNEGDLQCSLQLHPSYKLDISLGEQYPDSAPPVTYLHCGDSVSTASRKAARGKLAEVTERSWKEQDGECLDVLVEELIIWLRQSDSIDSIEDDRQGRSSNISSDKGSIVNPSEESPSLDKIIDRETEPQSSSPTTRIIQRTLIWSHHLLALSKRKDILSWSRELHLGGFSRPGYPGAILVEGNRDSVNEFVSRIKELRWQALQVRAEQSAEGRVCGDGSEGVVEVESLGEVVERLRRLDEGLAEMFLEGMRIGR